MNLTPQTYMDELRAFPRYLPGSPEPFRGGELPEE
eukprot:COSAG02_NODE_45967_length_352_cov_1.636364_1_plen_34_part_10